MAQNLANHHFTEQQWTELDAAIAKVAELMQPLLVPVTPTQKKMAVKMGDGSEAFCRQALGVIEENLALMPRSFDAAEMRRDLATHDALNDRIVRLTRLLEQARDTELVMGSDVMVAALEGYAVLKAVGKGEGIQGLRRMLGRRFEQGPREPANTPAPVAG